MPGSLPVAAVPGDRRHPASGTAEEVAEGNGAPFRAAQKDPGICKASRKRARAPGCGMLCSVRAATAAAAPDGPCPHGACCVCPVPAPQGKRINVSITGSVFASITYVFLPWPRKRSRHRRQARGPALREGYCESIVLFPCIHSIALSRPLGILPSCLGNGILKK